MTSHDFIRSITQSAGEIKDYTSAVAGLSREDAADLIRESTPVKRAIPIAIGSAWPPHVQKGAIANVLTGWRLPDMIKCGIRLLEELRPVRGMACFAEFEGDPLVIDETGTIRLVMDGREDWLATADQSRFLALYADMVAMCHRAFRKQAAGVTVPMLADRFVDIAGGIAHRRFCEALAAEVPI